jgi:hypothetical protein
LGGGGETNGHEQGRFRTEIAITSIATSAYFEAASDPKVSQTIAAPKQAQADTKTAAIDFPQSPHRAGADHGTLTQAFATPTQKTPEQWSELEMPCPGIPTHLVPTTG